MSSYVVTFPSSWRVCWSASAIEEQGAPSRPPVISCAPPDGSRRCLLTSRPEDLAHTRQCKRSLNNSISPIRGASTAGGYLYIGRHASDNPLLGFIFKAQLKFINDQTIKIKQTIKRFLNLSLLTTRVSRYESKQCATNRRKSARLQQPRSRGALECRLVSGGTQITPQPYGCSHMRNKLIKTYQVLVKMVNFSTVLSVSETLLSIVININIVQIRHDPLAQHRQWFYLCYRYKE